MKVRGFSTGFRFPYKTKAQYINGMKKLSLILLLLLTVVLLLPARGAGDKAAEDGKWTEELILDQPIPDDPQVRYGVLENGLTYYVRSNSRPSGTAELRLIVKAGSLLEDEDQKGLAHFLEHMLFNGTRRFPENELIDVLESFGMEFGPDINAYTSFSETVYKLNVRSDNEEQFLTGLDVLEEWAFHARLDEDEFEKERGVIQEEWRVGRGADARMLDKMYPVLFQGSRYAKRLPIGDMEVVKNAPVEALRRFYRDWYRPNLMAVVAVGDFDSDETVKLIRERFSGYSNPVNVRPRPEFLIPDHENTLAVKVQDKEAVHSSVQLYVKHKPFRAEYRSDVREELSEQLFYIMLNRRLTEISRRENPPFLYGYSFTSPFSRTCSLAGLAASVPENAVQEGLEALVAEAERVQRYGFLKVELDRAKTDVMSYFENYWKQRGDLESRDLIPAYVDAFINGDAFPSIDWQWETMQQVLPGITLEDVNSSAGILLSDLNRVIVVNGPESETLNVLDEEKLPALIEALEKRSLKKWEDKTPQGPLVSEEPQPGKIVSREVIPGTDIQDWTLSNGARVLLKKTDFRRDEILFQSVSPGGLSLVDDADYISGWLAVQAAEESGLGTFSADALEKVLTGKNVSLSAYIQETYEGLSGSATPEHLETLFQLIYLRQGAPREDSEAWSVLMNRMTEALRNRDASPSTRYEDLVWQTVYDNHLRSLPVTLERLEEADSERAAEIFTERFSSAGNFTYVFVGDFDFQEMEHLVSVWLGALPAGNPDETWADREMRNRTDSRRVSLKAGLEPLSLVSQIWLGEWDGSFIERYRIQSLASALQMRLTKTIREEYGGTYTVGVYPHLTLQPHADYRFIIRYSCSPERVGELSAKVKEIVDEWRQSEPEKKYAADVAESQKKALKEKLERNNWWLGQIVFAAVSETPVDQLLNRTALYNTLSPKVLSNTARKYLDDSRYIEAVLYPDKVGE